MSLAVLAIAAAVVGAIVGYAIGNVRGFNRGFSTLAATEAVKTCDRLVLHLRGRCGTLRRLKDDPGLGLPTRSQSQHRLLELQAVALVVFGGGQILEDVGADEAVDELTKQRAGSAH